MRRFQPLSAIQDRKVVDPSGVHVGRVHDILFDLSDGRIEYVCIAVASNVRIEPYEAVVPWSALRVSESGACLEVSARSSLLQQIAQPVSERR